MVNDHVNAILESGTSDTLEKKSLLLLEELTLMNNFGNLIGLAVEKVGKKRVAQEPIIEENS